MKFVRIFSAAVIAASLSTSAFAGGFANSKAGAIGFGVGFGDVISTGSQQVTSTLNGTSKFGSAAGAQASNTSFAAVGGTHAFAASGGAAFSSSTSAKK